MNAQQNTPDENDWTAKLRAVLDDAKEAAQDDNLAVRMNVVDRLTSFIEESFPNDARIQALDNIAAQAATGLLEATIDERIKNIAARNVELVRLNKTFEAATAVAREEAATLRLERVRSVLTALNEGISAIKDLRDVLETGTDRELTVSLDKAAGAIRDVRAELQRTKATAAS